MTNAINTRGKQLVLRLNEVCDGKQRTLSEKKEALEQLAGITDHCVEFVNAALAGGSDTAVLHSKRAVTAHLQRIKSRRADIPNPEIPVRISLALDKLPELVRVLSTVGAIVVDGKVDGAQAQASQAQGPYHPPPPQAPAQAPAQPPHSAVMALQNVAMHQVRLASPRSGPGGPTRFLTDVSIVPCLQTLARYQVSLTRRRVSSACSLSIFPLCLCFELRNTGDYFSPRIKRSTSQRSRFVFRTRSSVRLSVK